MKKAFAEQEFLKAYDELADAIFRHCYFRTFSREDARDIAQDTFVRTWEYLADGRTVENLRAFLYKVANNLIVDRSRRRPAVSLESLREEGFDVPTVEYEQTVSGIHGRQVLQVVGRLDPKYRDAVIMRYIDDLGPREIAEITGETENAVSVRIHRGIQQLRDILAEHTR